MFRVYMKLFQLQEDIIQYQTQYKMDGDKLIINLDNLNQVFLKHDQDHDGKVNAQQTLNILNLLGYNDLYIGSVKKIIRLLNYRQFPNQSEQIDFSQLEEYAEAKQTQGRFQLWKAKLQALEAIQQGHKQIFGQQDNGGAAPGQENNSGNFGPQNSQQGQVQIKIGQMNIFSERVYATLEKVPAQQLKPFARISIDRPSHDAAKKTEQLFKKLHQTLLQILKNQSPEYISEIQSVKFITNTNGSTFNLFITTSNEYILNLLKVYGQFVDSLIKDALKAKISLQYLFNFDVNKFITDPNSSFYSMLTNNCQLNIKWNVFQVFKTLKEIAFKSKVLHDLQYNKSDQFCTFLIGLLHLEQFTGKMAFENVGQNAVQQLGTKQQISNMFKELKEQITSLQSEEGSLNIMDLIRQLDGKVKMEVMIGEWKLNGQVQVKDFTKLFTQDIQVSENYND